MSFGTELREQRERRGVGLSAIAERTKVSERYLRALEEDAHDQLPGGVFNRGMVRGYCQQLELDEGEWLDRFAASVQSTGGEPDWNSFAENVKRNRQSAAGASRRRWWGVALMLLALAALGWGVWHYLIKRQVMPQPATPTVAMQYLPSYDSV